MQHTNERLTRIEQRQDDILRGKYAQDKHVDELTAEVLSMRAQKKGGAL